MEFIEFTDTRTLNLSLQWLKTQQLLNYTLRTTKTNNLKTWKKTYIYIYSGFKMNEGTDIIASLLLRIAKFYYGWNVYTMCL